MGLKPHLPPLILSVLQPQKVFMMHTADRLLMLLAAGQPQLQADLCAALAITPAALQQALQQLRSQGISLQQIAPEIYQLSEALELLDKSKIFHALNPLAREQLSH